MIKINTIQELNREVARLGKEWFEDKYRFSGVNVQSNIHESGKEEVQYTATVFTRSGLTVSSFNYCKKTANNPLECLDHLIKHHEALLAEPTKTEDIKI